MCAGLLVSQSLTVIVKVISRFPGQKHEEDSDDDMADELLGHELFADYLSGAPWAANSLNHLEGLWQFFI